MKRILVALAFSGIIGGCASGTAELQYAAGNDVDVARELSVLKAELAVLEQPQGVGDDLWADLCAELERAVTAGAEGPGAVRAGVPQRSASQLEQPAVSFEYAPRFFHSSGLLQTYHVLVGDYDENGEVNAADLVPLSQFYRDSAKPATLFPADSRQYVVDGDSNGEINISDVTVIGHHYKERAVAYNIYASENIAADFPHEAQESLIEPLHSVPFTGLHNDGELRRVIEFELQDQLYSHYWLRMETEEGETAPSALAFHADGEAPHVARFIEHWTQLSYDSESGQVIWSNRLGGDANSNGEINIADLSVLGASFGNVVEPFYGLDPGETGVPGDPDMNRDLVVDNHDLLLVQSYLNMGKDGFYLYHTTESSELPGDAWSEETLTPLNSAAAFGSNSHDLGPGATGFLWLRAYRGDEVGPVSAMIQL